MKIKRLNFGNTKAFLMLTVAEILISLLFFFENPSDHQEAFLLGFSVWRISVGIFLVLLAGICLVILFKTFKSPEWVLSIKNQLSEWLGQKGRWYATVTVLFYFIFIGIAFLLLANSPLFNNFKYYSNILGSGLIKFEVFKFLVYRLIPILILIIVILFQSVLYLFFTFSNMEKGSGVREILKTLLVLSILTISVLHWLILVMELKIFKNIPGWYWDIIAKPLVFRDLYFLLILVLSLVFVKLILNNPGSVKQNLLIVFFLGLIIQVGFGFLEGQGFESLRFKYVDSYHRAHSVYASESNRGLIETVKNYEELYGEANYEKTKPPGTLLIYLSLKKITNYFFPRDTIQGKFDVLTTVEAYLFPVISFFVVFVIFEIARKLGPENEGVLPGIIYILLPNVILLPLFLDQVMYPLFFSIGVLITISAVEKRDFKWSFMNGVAIYLLAFFSFSMLPLIPFVYLYIVIDFLISKKEKRSLSKNLSMVVGTTLGVIFMIGLFYWALDYNVFVRYQNAMEGVRNFDFVLRTNTPDDEVIQNTSFLLPPRYISSAFILNNTEFASVLGFPVYLLFLIQSVRTVVTLFKNQATSADGVLLTYFGTFLFLNIFAPIQGEAARLWLFWAPMFSIFVGTVIPNIFNQYKNFIFFMMVIQLITIFLTFKFQDLFV